MKANPVWFLSASPRRMKPQRGGLSRVIEQVNKKKKKRLWAFSEHQQSEGLEVLEKKAPPPPPPRVSVEAKHTNCAFQYLHTLPRSAGDGRNPGYMLGKGSPAESSPQPLTRRFQTS